MAAARPRAQPVVILNVALEEEDGAIAQCLESSGFTVRRCAASRGSLRQASLQVVGEVHFRVLRCNAKATPAAQQVRELNADVRQSTKAMPWVLCVPDQAAARLLGLWDALLQVAPSVLLVYARHEEPLAKCVLGVLQRLKAAKAPEARVKVAKRVAAAASDSCSTAQHVADALHGALPAGLKDHLPAFDVLTALHSFSLTELAAATPQVITANSALSKDQAVMLSHFLEQGGARTLPS